MQIAASVTGKVYDEGDCVRKVVHENFRRAYLHYLYCSKHCSAQYLLLPTELILHEDRLEVVMRKGTPACAPVDFDRFVLDALRSVCALEEKGLLHGDLKLQNFVFIDDCFKLIDFDLLVSKDDMTTRAQSHFDVHGHALRQGVQVANNNLHQAFYAFCYTCFRALHPNVLVVPVELNYSVGDLQVKISADTVAAAIHEDYATWIEEFFPPKYHAFFAGLLGEDKYASFAQALRLLCGEEEAPCLDVWSRRLYERGCELQLPLREMYIAFDNFYTYLHYASPDDMENYIGACFYHHTCDFSSPYVQRMITEGQASFLATEIPDQARMYFIYEYALPGTWRTKVIDIGKILGAIAQNPAPYVYLGDKPVKR